MKRIRRLGAVLLAGVLLIVAAGGWVLSENALRRLRAPFEVPLADGEIEVEVDAPDGVTLRGALAPGANSECSVLLLHGVADSRNGVARQTALLRAAGYATLRADVRAHGASGGDRLSFGVAERGDTAAWVRYLKNRGARRVCGFGVSMGAGILLQTPGEFAAIVADSPFACFPDVAVWRVSRTTQWSPAAAALFVNAALWIERLQSGQDLRQACPEKALRASATPVLLIHGERDMSIPPEHSQRLAAACGPNCTLKIVPGAEHTLSVAVAGAQYRDWVLEFLRRNGGAPVSGTPQKPRAN
jgi:fermentation-respiration switch protein FrsA (DUF1100 family)